MKIALSQNNFHVGNFEHNCSKIISQVKNAEKKGAELVVFPELAITGYPPLDFLEFDDFIEKSHNCINKIAQECKNIAAIIGAPSLNKNSKGKPLYNSAFFLAGGEIQQVFNKGLIPNYDVFDEYRYFEPAKEFNIINYKGYKIAVTICEDLWSLDNKTLYSVSPMKELAKQNPCILINIAASPFSYNQHIDRKSILARNAINHNIPIIYVNHTGANTELLFDGGSMTINARGEIINELKYFDEDFFITSVDSLNTGKGIPIPLSPGKDEKIRLIHDGLIMGIKDYFYKSGFSKAILGLSGGIDSAVVAALTAKALGSGNVKALLMPGEYSSQHSVDDAVELAKNLGISYEIIPINDVYQSFNNTLEHYFTGLAFDTTEENIQSRARAVLLMAFSNKFGHILLNTSNKSEAAVGYGTLYGDMCGGLSVIGDVYKTDVFKLARFMNREVEIIPVNTIVKPPSAELRPDQKDTDSLPDYEVLDEILYSYIELREKPQDIINKGYDPVIVHKVLSMVNRSEHKRFQTPPVLRVSPKAFGMGRRMPIVAKYL